MKLSQLILEKNATQKHKNRQWANIFKTLTLMKLEQNLMQRNGEQYMRLFLDNIEALHKFLCTVKISSQAILQMRGNKSGVGADPHPY